MDGIGSVGGSESIVPMDDTTKIAPGEVFQPPGPDSLPKERGLEVKMEQRLAVRAAYNQIIGNYLHVRETNSKIVRSAYAAMIQGLPEVIKEIRR